MLFFPRADAAVLSSSKHEPLPAHPRDIGPVYDPENVTRPVELWTAEQEGSCYPPKPDGYAPSSVPPRPPHLHGRYLRATLARNERLRLSMLWYYTRDALSQTELLHGLQEKALLAQESTGWEFVVIGILDINVYIRLATVGLKLGILPRGETLCAHTVTQPPGSVFLLPNMLEDWRFEQCPYVEQGGLLAYAGAPLRLQHESGDCVALGSLCVASSTPQDPLTKPQQQTLARLADWIVADMVQCTRANRQRQRRKMAELIATLQQELDDDRGALVELVLDVLQETYAEAQISLQSSKQDQVEIEGHDPVPLSALEHGFWEDVDLLDDYITRRNHEKLPTDRVVRLMCADCESILGPSTLVVASREYQLVFDDVDLWFIQACAGIITQTWHKRLLTEAMRAKDKFLRGFTHQLRTPIHGILGSAELLAEELMARNQRETSFSGSELLQEAADVAARTADKPRAYGDYLDTIKMAGRDLISIVNSMITLNRWTDVAMEQRAYAMHLAQDFEKELSDEISRAILGDPRYRASIVFVDKCLSLGPYTFLTDLGLLRHSIFPLIVNALQNTSEGAVTVTTAIYPDTRELVVDVQDTGRGIHPDDWERIFEPYEKIGVHSTGAGLGLTLSSKFAALLRGSITLVSSEMDRGSHFRATFRDIELASPPDPWQRLGGCSERSTLRFHALDCVPTHPFSLTRCFGDFLTQHGFTASDDIQDCLVIFEHAADAEQHQMNLSRIQAHQVGICLVPTSAANLHAQQPAQENIIYVPGPFLTQTMALAIREADQALLAIQTSRNAMAEAPVLAPVLTSPEKTTDPNGTDAITVSHAQGEPQTNSLANGINTLSLQERETTPLQVPTASARPTALLVDDNIVNLRILQMYCKKRGLQYHCAADGKQAVDIYTQQQALALAGDDAAPIQLILMDLQMPVCDGLEATRLIRRHEGEHDWNRSVVFMVTGQDSPTDRGASVDAGADEYFVKPVGMKVLDQHITKYFAAFADR